MIMKTCECPRRPETVLNADKGPITCPHCGGIVLCDLCKRKVPNVAIFPIAICIVADHYVCGEHAWAAIAKTPQQGV
jgi:hypothetical protein